MTLLTPISLPQRLFGAGYGIFALGMLCVIGPVELCHAQGTLNVDASISAVQNGSTYDYSILLNNPSGSPSVDVFWYAWVPGAFYLSVNPSSVTPAAGWNDSIVGNYSIEFTTASAPLAGGSSATFAFTSTEAPATLFGSSADISYVYTGGALSSPGQQFTVSSVPEPSTIGLMLTGLTGVWYVRRKR